jgi:predicted secreted protein
MTAIDIAAGPLAEADHRSQLRRAVIASTVGTTIEWYDFLLYSVVTGFKLSSSLHSHSLDNESGAV